MAVAVSRDSNSGNSAASTNRLTMPSSASGAKIGWGVPELRDNRSRAAAASSRSRSAPSILNTVVAESRFRSAADRDPAAAAMRPSASWLNAAWYRSPSNSKMLALCAKSWCASWGRPACSRMRPRMRRNSPQLAGVVLGSSRDSQVSSRCSASSMRPAATKASQAARSAWMASAGGTPGACANASAIAIASSYARRLIASLTPNTLSDHSYQRIVCVPYAP